MIASPDEANSLDCEKCFLRAGNALVCHEFRYFKTRNNKSALKLGVARTG